MVTRNGSLCEKFVGSFGVMSPEARNLARLCTLAIAASLPTAGGAVSAWHLRRVRWEVTSMDGQLLKVLVISSMALSQLRVNPPAKDCVAGYRSRDDSIGLCDFGFG